LIVPGTALCLQAEMKDTGDLHGKNARMRFPLIDNRLVPLKIGGACAVSGFYARD